MMEAHMLSSAVVLDNGSGMIKAGLAGDDAPKCCFPSFVGRPKYERAMAGGVEGSQFIGNRAAKHRGLLRLNYPLRHGIIEDWDDMELIWKHVFNDELKISSEDHPVLLTEPPLNPNKHREKAAEILFETFNVPALYTSIQAVLSLYATGRTTGVVIDSGDGVTHSVPVFAGFALKSSIQRMDVAGRDVTEHLRMMLRKSGYVFQTSSERDEVRKIKEEMCFVSLDPIKEAKDWLNPATRLDGKIAEYTLPDGSVIKMGAERFQAPEILFKPELYGVEYEGVQHMVFNSIYRADMDLRRQLFGEILISGGTTLTKGFGARLLNELQALAPKDMKIRIYAPPERRYTTWTGGSILAGLDTFKKMLVTKDEWQENPDIIHSRFH